MNQNLLVNSEASPPIAMNHMTHPLEEGGRKVLDLSACNNAIKVMKLKKILDYSVVRPLASDAALAIIIGSLPKGIQNKNTNDNSISDVFLQTAYLRKRYFNRTLPNEIQDILNTGAKYNVALDAPRISINHKAQLPVDNGYLR